MNVFEKIRAGLVTVPETPSLVVDKSIAWENILRVQEAVDQAGCCLRPHVKTHKMPYFTKPFNGMEPLQCTWWARARGLQYVMTFYPGQISADEFASSNHGNGGEVYGYAKAYGLFGTGTTPKPNSLVSFTSSSGAGHVAYVEAVDYVNQVYYCSEAGSGKYWGSVNLIPY